MTSFPFIPRIAQLLALCTVDKFQETKLEKTNFDDLFYQPTRTLNDVEK